jgi:hypothetical protein
MLRVPDWADVPAAPRLIRPQFGARHFDRSDHPAEFHLSHGDWVGLLLAHGFEILDLVELGPSEGATTDCTFVT